MATTVKKVLAGNKILSSGSFSITKKVSPAEFLDIVKRKPDSIKSSKFVVPKIGSNSLGKFLVKFK